MCGCVKFSKKIISEKRYSQAHLHDMMPFAWVQRMYIYICTQKWKVWDRIHKAPSPMVTQEEGVFWGQRRRGTVTFHYTSLTFCTISHYCFLHKMFLILRLFLWRFAFEGCIAAACERRVGGTRVEWSEQFRDIRVFRWQAEEGQEKIIWACLQGIAGASQVALVV